MYGTIRILNVRLAIALAVCLIFLGMMTTAAAAATGNDIQNSLQGLLKNLGSLEPQYQYMTNDQPQAVLLTPLDVIPRGVLSQVTQRESPMNSAILGAQASPLYDAWKWMPQMSRLPVSPYIKSSWLGYGYGSLGMPYTPPG